MTLLSVMTLLQTLRWRCVEWAVHHERNVRGEQYHTYVARTSNNRVISSGDLYCCLLPQCEALRTCRSNFPIAIPLAFFFRLSEFFFYPLLARLDIGASVEQPFDCLIVQNLQAVQSMRRSMDWTLEDNVVDGLFFCATLTG